MQPNIDEVAALRKNKVVAAWIDDYAEESISGKRNPSCKRCGWPHAQVSPCGMGATFGCVRLGGVNYYIDASNVEWMLSFVKTLGQNGFHWKDEIFFLAEAGNVIVTSLWQYNNHPQVRRWSIPLAEWKSIVDSVQTQQSIIAA